MKRYVMTILVLVAAASAVELYWDDGVEGGATRDELMGVTFGDCDGPGDTDGQPGTIHEFRVAVSSFQSGNPPQLYIYSVGQFYPDELLLGPLSGTWEAGYWSVFTPDQSVEVPSAFSVVVGNVLSPSNLLDDGSGPDYPDPYSWYYDDGAWQDRVRDYMLRVEWTPDTAVTEMTWGRIKADQP